MSKKFSNINQDNNNMNNKNSFKLPDIPLPDDFFQDLEDIEEKYTPNQKEKEENNYDLLEPELEENNNKNKKENKNEEEYYNEEFFGLGNKEEKENKEEEDNCLKLENIDGKENSQGEGKFDINDFFFGDENDNKKSKEKEEKINEINDKKKTNNENKENKKNTNSFLLTEDDINLFRDNFLEDEDNQQKDENKNNDIKIKENQKNNKKIEDQNTNEEDNIDFDDLVDLNKIDEQDYDDELINNYNDNDNDNNNNNNNNNKNYNEEEEENEEIEEDENNKKKLNKKYILNGMNTIKKNKSKEKNLDFNNNNIGYGTNWDIKNSNCILPDLKELSRPQPWDEDVIDINKRIFGYKSFRPMQQEIINAYLMNRDIFACMPTGSGKSLCYQIPAILSENTVTIVVMPLISLILDQAKFLTGLGVKVLYLESGLNPRNFDIDNMFQNENSQDNFKIIFITPEKLNSKTGATFDFLKKLYSKNLFKRIVIDEAHCVSQWGRDFRPDYLELKKIKRQFPKVTILALTATGLKKFEMMSFFN